MGSGTILRRPKVREPGANFRSVLRIDPQGKVTRGPARPPAHRKERDERGTDFLTLRYVLWLLTGPPARQETRLNDPISKKSRSNV